MATFPYTPSFVHGETFGYAVTVHQFGDWTEQRYLRSRQQGVRLSYEFARADSGTVAGISSFFLAQGGPRDSFTALDHRTKVAHTVRFAAPTLEQVIGPLLRKRRMVVDFIVEQGGATPIATTYTAPVLDDFCDPVVPTSGVAAPDAAEARDGWPWIGGPSTVTPTLRYLPVGGFGGPAQFPQDVDIPLPSGTSLMALTMQVQNIGSAASVQLACLINGVRRSELVLTTSATGTVTVTGTITTSTRAGTLACLVTSLGTALATGPTITWGVGYTHPY